MKQSNIKPLSILLNKNKVYKNYKNLNNYACAAHLEFTSPWVGFLTSTHGASLDAKNRTRPFERPRYHFSRSFSQYFDRSGLK